MQLLNEKVMADDRATLCLGMYSLGEVSEADHQLMIDLCPLRKQVTLTDGTPVGRVVMAGRVPASLDKSYTNQYVLEVVWASAAIMELAREADISLTPQGQVVLHGEL